MTWRRPPVCRNRSRYARAARPSSTGHQWITRRSTPLSGDAGRAGGVGATDFEAAPAEGLLRLRAMKWLESEKNGGAAYVPAREKSRQAVQGPATDPRH